MASAATLSDVARRVRQLDVVVGVPATSNERENVVDVEVTRVDVTATERADTIAHFEHGEPGYRL